MEKITDDMIEKYLLKDEKTLWTGKPDARKLFTKSDIFLVPFSIIWAAFALLWELYAIMSMIGLIEENGAGMGIIFTLFGLPFVFIGLYIMVGRFIVKKRNKERTLYAITNRRILILNTGSPEKLITKNINQVTSVNLSLSRGGIGSIIFGEIPLYNKFYSNTGMQKWFFYGGEEVPTFYDIHDAKMVFEVINNIK